MDKYITCPCCGKEILITIDDGNNTVFYNTQNQEELSMILQEENIELAILNGGDDSG